MSNVPRLPVYYPLNTLRGLPDDIRLLIYELVFAGVRVRATPRSVSAALGITNQPTGVAALLEIEELVANRLVYGTFVRHATFVVGSVAGLDWLCIVLQQYQNSVTSIEISVLGDWQRRLRLPNLRLGHPAHNSHTLRTTFKLLPLCVQTFPQLQRVNFHERLDCTLNPRDHRTLWGYNASGRNSWNGFFDYEDHRPFFIHQLATGRYLHCPVGDGIPRLAFAACRVIHQHQVAVGFRVEMRIFRFCRFHTCTPIVC